MITINEVFDAGQVEPQQRSGNAPHPIGNKFPFTITNTEIKETSTKQGMFVLTHTSEAGVAISRYNLWHENATTKDIARKQFSALCHAVGIFKVDFSTQGANLRGARGLMDIGFQNGHEPTAEKPEGGYTEIKMVYNLQGVAPGYGNQAPAQAQQPQASNGFQSPQATGQGQPNNSTSVGYVQPQQQAPQQWGGNQPGPQPQVNSRWQPDNADTPTKAPWRT